MVNLELLKKVVADAEETGKLNNRELFTALMNSDVTKVARRIDGLSVTYTLTLEPQRPIITLTEAERAVADKLGKAKNDKSERDGRKADWYDSKGGGVIENHQDGVACEMAHLKYLEIPLEDFETKHYRMDTFKMADVGRNTEIRSTKMTNYAGKVKDRDRDERVVVFYRKLNRLQFQALGWLTVAEAKRVGEYLDPNGRGKPAYFVKETQLKPLETLPKETQSASA